MFAVDVEPLALPVGAIRAADAGALVPGKTEPFEGFHYLLFGLLGRTRPVGILDPQDEPPAVLFCPDPAEQSHVGRADMHIPCGRGGDAGSDSRHSPPPAFAVLAQESLIVTVRLKTGLSGVESTGSLKK